MSYIRSLPICADPCVFGLHSNADITKDNQETNQLLDGVLLTLPRQTGGGAKSPQVFMTFLNFFLLMQIFKRKHFMQTSSLYRSFVLSDHIIGSRR